MPDKIVNDKSGANTAAIHSIQKDTGAPIEMRRVKYLNNIVEQSSGHQAHLPTYAGLPYLPFCAHSISRY